MNPFYKDNAYKGSGTVGDNNLKKMSANNNISKRKRNAVAKKSRRNNRRP